MAANSSDPLDASETITVSLSGLRGDDFFELGGRAGNVVTSSKNAKIGKGWRLLQVNGAAVPTDAARVQDALDAARRKGKYTATFFGGKLAGGGGMNMEALARAAVAAQKLAAAPSKPAAPAKPPPPKPKPSAAPAPNPPASPPPAPRPTLAPAPAPAPAPPPLPRSASARSDIGVPATKEDAQHAFISFDADRDGFLSLKDFQQMIATINNEYDFVELGTPGFGRLVNQNFSRAGGRRANPDDSDDEDDGVTPAGFAKWYFEFMLQCDQRRADEYTATKSMGDRQYEQYVASRTMELRNRNYPLLRSL